MDENLVLNEIYSLERKDAQLDYFSELSEDLFDNTVNYKAFSEILLRGDKVDSFSLYPIIGKAAINFDASTPNIDLPSHIRLLKERKYKRDLVKSIKEHLTEIETGTHHDDIDDVKNGLIADLAGIELGSTSTFIDYKEQTKHIDSNLNDIKEIEGHSWGLKALDDITSGIVVPRLIVLGGLKKSGKTRFLMYVRKQLYYQNIPSIFLSLEMPAYEIAKLTYSTFCGIEDINFRSQNFLSRSEKETYERFKKTLDFNLIPTECMASISIEQVMGRVKRYSKLYPKGVVFIDYLQRIEHDEHRQAQELEKISKLIANSTRAYNITIILLSQLNNMAENNIPSTGHLKGSGGIGEAADTIILFDNIYRRTKQVIDKGKIDLILEQRYNDSGKISIYSELGKCAFGDLPPMGDRHDI
ncbi:MAG: hypothetical protein KKH44_07760 [Bacteroidetes bacterium]|nr:hypothetical protein [Bacteroidota bacterium]